MLAFIIVPLLAPVADKLGIDLIWFGVLLGVNMQTSFMHPPFGFALFYLRSVAPGMDYLDKVTGKLTAPVTTGQIYWGAVPFVVIQVVMVAIIIAFPGLVTTSVTKSAIDPSQIELQIETPEYAPEAPEDSTADKSSPAQAGKEADKTQDSSNESAVDDIERSLKRSR